MRRIVFLTIVFFAVTFSSCRKNEYEPIPTELGEAYFPLAVGHAWIYEVDSVVYSSFNVNRLRDTFHYWVKHEIERIYSLNGSDSSYLVNKYISSDEGKNWRYNRSLIFEKNNANVQVVDEGVRSIPLVFPILLYKSWDVNLYNNQGEKNYSYIETNGSCDLPDSSSVKCVQVLHEDLENFVQKYYGMERYAESIGLIERHFTALEDIYDSTRTNGYDYRYRLIEFIPAP